MADNLQNRKLRGAASLYLEYNPVVSRTSPVVKGTEVTARHIARLAKMRFTVGQICSLHNEVSELGVWWALRHQCTSSEGT